MDLLVNAVRDFCLAQGFDKTFWLAYSGGLDSHVLLHLLADLRIHYPLKLHCVHIHHGLSPHADEWHLQCKQNAYDLNVEFTSFFIDLKSEKVSLEENARKQRYSVFSKIIQSSDVLLTAHHQDDQAETLLLQMLRGAGPKGMAAMPVLKTFAKGFHARPLLDITRTDLKIYANQRGLKWIEDESNLNRQFTRNFLRHEVLPLLQKRWPTLTNTLARVAENCAEAQAILDDVAVQDLAYILSSSKTILIKKLISLSQVRQRNVLRAWLHQSQVPIPSSIKLKQIQKDMLTAREDKAPHITWDGIELRRYRDELFVMPCLLPHDASQTFPWDFKQPLHLPSMGILSAKSFSHQGFVTFRKGGETLQLEGRSHHHELKNLFQEWGIPPWLRDRIPLVFVGEKLIAVVGYFISEGYEFILEPFIPQSN